MSVSIVPGQTRTVTLPASQEQWKLFLEVAADEILDGQADYAKELVEAFEKKDYLCSAHCECALIQYLTLKHNDSWDDIPVFSYIGVSKLSCSACRIWFESFNEVGQQKFYTRGSHGKWYWPWGMPMAEECFGEGIGEESQGKVAPAKSLEEIMAGKISRQYIGHLNKPMLYKRDSDSTDATFSVGELKLSDDNKESGPSIVGRLKQKLRGTH